jgi:hypothetical protein
MKTQLILLALTLPVFSATAHELELPEISVLGTPERRSAFDFLPTVSKIGGAKLDRKKQTTLGETLSQEVGVSSSFFGPNASRPVIRGLDGDRVRMLENGIGLLDASGASPDQIAAALEAKQTRNEGRTWPDWRTADPDKAIEHVKPLVRGEP